MRRLYIILFLVIMILMAAIPALADDSDFVIVNHVLTAYTGSGGNVESPPTVTEIGDGVFENNTSILSVTFPDNVTSIGERAFAGCTNLRSSVSVPADDMIDYVEINDDYEIDPDRVWVLYADTRINGNLYHGGDEIDLNSYKLKVTGELYQAGGRVFINGGELDVTGNYIISDGILDMTNDTDIVRVGGNFETTSRTDHSDYLTAGTLYLGGNFTQNTASDGTDVRNFAAQQTHRTVLNGSGEQVINFNDIESHFGTLESANPLLRLDGATSWLLLDSDIEIAEAGWSTNWPKYEGQVIDLNGHKLTVNGDLYQFDGRMFINGGELDVIGNYNVHDGILDMTNDVDIVRVGGYFETTSRTDHSEYLTAGTLYVGGNFTQNTASDGTDVKNFAAQQTHRTVLNGSGEQVINFNDIESHFGILESANPQLRLDGAASWLLLDSDIEIAEAGWSTNWPKYEGQVIDLNGHKLTVNGDLYQFDGRMFINGGELDVIGNYNVHDGILDMTNNADIVRVGGNFDTTSGTDHSDYLTAGTLFVGGNFTQNGTNVRNFAAQQTHRTVLNGSGEQIIYFNDIESHFGTLESANPLLRLDCAASWLLLDSDIEIAEAGWSTNWPKYEGQVIDLNGHKLTVNGDLYQFDGRMFINGGELDVIGNYNVHDGILDMTNNADIVRVGGYFETTSRTDHSEYLTAGTLYVGGNFTQNTASDGTDVRNFAAQQTHRTVLNGSGEQTIYFNDTESHFGTLEIRRPKDQYEFTPDPCWLVLVENLNPTETPGPTSEPTETVTPEITDTPTVTVTPEITDTPTETVTPVITDTPTETVTPEITDTPTETVTPGTVTPDPEITVTPEPPVPGVTITDLDDGSRTIDLGTKGQTAPKLTYKLGASVSPEDADQKVTWSSSDKTIAAVDANGVVTAKKLGKVTITATAADGSGVSASVNITVVSKVQPGSLRLAGTKIVAVGKTTALEPFFSQQVEPQNTAVTWKSSNTAVAKVSTAGVVTGVKAGTAKITATAKDGSKVSAAMTITVKPAATKVTISDKDNGTKTIDIGTTGTKNEKLTYTLKAVVKPSDAWQSVKWTSSDKTIARVNTEGVVEGLKPGTVTIKATTKDGTKLSASVKIKVVSNPQPGSVTIKGSNVVGVGKSVGLKAGFSQAVQPTNKNVTWTSSNKAVAKISSKGVVTGVKIGTATIKACSKADKSVCKSLKISVKTPAKKVTIKDKDNGTKTIDIGTKKLTYKLGAAVTPSGAAQAVTWTSSDKTVAVVSAKGVVTGKKPGTVTITATTKDGTRLKGMVKIKVVSKVQPGSLSISGADTVAAGKTVNLKTVFSQKVQPTNKDVIWKSNKNGVATVSTTGVVTGVKSGSAEISACSKENTKICAKMTVTVTKP